MTDPTLSPGPIKIQRGESMPPSGKTDFVNLLFHHGRRWSPTGIAALILLVVLVVGEDRIIRIIRAFSAEEELLLQVTALRADLEIERAERTKMQAWRYATDKNLSAVCDFTSKMNGQRPNKSWCSDDGKAVEFTQLLATNGENGPLVTEYEWRHGLEVR